MPMDIIFQGMPMSLFQAKQQWSKMTNVVLMLCSSSLPPETPPLALGGPANQHSKTGHLWSKLTSARARQGVMANAGCVRRVFWIARSTYSPLKVVYFWRCFNLLQRYRLY